MFAGWKELLDDTEPMDTSDSPWCWFYQAECGIWHRIEDDPVNPISSSELEMLYLRNPNRIIIFSTAGGNFRIDFHGYMKTNVKTGQVQKIKRSPFTERAARCKCADLAPPVPTHWEHMDPNLHFKAFNVNWQTSEYKKVENYVKEVGLLKKPLRCIYRIQNIDLWELYCRKKKQLIRIKGTSDINEEWLFHGTGKNNVHNICLYNFDCRISEKLRIHGHILGKGTYFAKHAAYADKYSTTQNQYNTTQIMFLAACLLGITPKDNLIWSNLTVTKLKIYMIAVLIIHYILGFLLSLILTKYIPSMCWSMVNKWVKKCSWKTNVKP